MESANYGLGGANDQISNDGGTLASVYEKGSKLCLEPLDYGDPTLVGNWTFAEGTGTVAYDYSGNGNAMPLASPTWIASGCKNTNCLQSNGGTSGSAPTSTSFSSLATNNAITVTFWLKSPVGIGNQNYVYGGSWCGNGNWLFYQYPTGSITWTLTGSNGCSSQQGVNAPFSNSSWVFIAGTFAGSAQPINLYINGVFQASTTGYLNLASGFTAVLGRGSDTFNNLRIYNRVLSVAQIAAMYAGGK
jgi:hypothetical protein